MGHVVVKYKVTIDTLEDGVPDYQGISDKIGALPEVQAIEIKPLAFGMMFIEVQVVLGEGEGIVDEFENRVRFAHSLPPRFEEQPTVNQC
jgi:translation elongation factor EF-1beta